MKTSQLPAAPTVATARLATLAGAIKATAEDIRTMTLAAGVEALEEALAACGRLELPLRFHIAPPGTRAVFITDEIYRKLANAGELAGLDDPAADLVAHIMEGAVDPADNLAAIASGLAGNHYHEADIIPFEKGGLEA